MFALWSHELAVSAGWIAPGWRWGDPPAATEGMRKGLAGAVERVFGVAITAAPVLILAYCVVDERTSLVLRGAAAVGLAVCGVWLAGIVRRKSSGQRP